MHKDIKFDHSECYKGRNGMGLCCGVEVSEEAGVKMIRPINSKGEIAYSCYIEIPNENVDEVCLAMSKTFSLVLDRLAKAGQLTLLVGIGSQAFREEIAERLKKG